MMKTCNQCSVDLVEGAKYCHQCGIPVLGKYAFINDKRSNILASMIKEIESLKKQLEAIDIENKRLQEETNKPLQWVTTTSSGSDNLVIDGNIGINSTSPSALLCVSSGNNSIQLGED